MTTNLDYSTLRIGFGDSDITGSILCNAICSFFWKKNGKEKNENDENEKNVIEISNRYFDAKVVLKELMEDESEEATEVMRGDEKEDGIILAFVDESGSNPVPFDTLTMIHERAENVGQCGDLLRLCVGITFTSVDTLCKKKEYEEEYSRRVLWCLDQGYEYIEADLSEQGQITGHDLREKDGFARIIEAMNGTVWSSSIRKTPKTTTLKSQPTPIPTPSIQTNKPQTTTTTIEKKKDLPSNQTNEQITNQKEESNTTTTKSINDNNQKSEETKEDIFIDEFEQVMKEASRIRSASKSGQLTDEERRQRAGDAASALMGLLDRMGFDDDDDDDIDSSDDDTHPNKKK